MEILDKIKDVAKFAGERANDAYETTKLKSRIHSENKEISKDLERIGVIFFKKIKSGEISADEELQAIIDRIDVHNQNIIELREALVSLANE
ncbi:hypothetical protein HMPREF0378_0623 [Eubacterium nodatum ATCC 33099]|nr:hypothetical protein HMPREF0378_0623 [Eubacterium nodatum ATCC 33099]